MEENNTVWVVAYIFRVSSFFTDHTYRISDYFSGQTARQLLIFAHPTEGNTQ